MIESGTVNLIVGYGVAAPGGIGVAPGATLNLYSYNKNPDLQTVFSNSIITP